MKVMLGGEYEAFLEAMDRPPALALRLNPARANALEAASPFIADEVPWAEHGFYLRSDLLDKPGASIAHAAGAFYIQEASAMIPAAVMNARPGERILDLCAAPGGKSTQMAAAMENRGVLVSNDPEPARARVLAGNLERMGAANAIVVNAYPDRLAQRWPEYFDGVLVDAPCSGEGMFRRDPAARDAWNPASPQGCARRQAEILRQAAALLRPGGRLVYSTCTFNETENEGSIRAFLANHGEFAPEDFHLEGLGDSRDGMLRAFPHRVRGDGHFVALLRKAPAPGRMKKTNEKKRAAHDGIAPEAAVKMLEETACALPDFIRTQRLFSMGDRVYCAPQDAPALQGVRTVSPGLCLMRAGRSHVEPAHALAMALPPALAHRRVMLSFEAACAYLTGEAIEYDGPQGWTLALYRDMPLGWAKASNGLLKNHLPSALRIAHPRP